VRGAFALLEDRLRGRRFGGNSTGGVSWMVDHESASDAEMARADRRPDLAAPSWTALSTAPPPRTRRTVTGRPSLLRDDDDRPSRRCDLRRDVHRHRQVRALRRRRRLPAGDPDVQLCASFPRAPILSVNGGEAVGRSSIRRPRTVAPQYGRIFERRDRGLGFVGAGSGNQKVGRRRSMGLP
jgi:hypothetical protein